MTCPVCHCAVYWDADPSGGRLVCFTGHWHQHVDRAGRPTRPLPLAKSHVHVDPRRERIPEMAALKREGWSLEQIGHHMGLNPATVSDWLREWEALTGERLPRLVSKRNGTKGAA